MNQEQFPFAEQLMKSHPHNIQHCYDKSGQPGMVALFVYASAISCSYLRCSMGQ